MIEFTNTVLLLVAIKKYWCDMYRNASAEDCDVMPRHGRAQAVGEQRAKGHHGVGQTAQPASMLRLGDFGYEDLKC